MKKTVHEKIVLFIAALLFAIMLLALEVTTLQCYWKWFIMKSFAVTKVLTFFEGLFVILLVRFLVKTNENNEEVKVLRNIVKLSFKTLTFLLFGYLLSFYI